MWALRVSPRDSAARPAQYASGPHGIVSVTISSDEMSIRRLFIIPIFRKREQSSPLTTSAYDSGPLIFIKSVIFVISKLPTCPSRRARRATILRSRHHRKGAPNPLAARLVILVQIHFCLFPSPTEPLVNQPGSFHDS